jgi:hypothetical protein
MYGWVRTIDRIIASVRPDPIDGPTLMIASDYGGTNARSQYRVNVFLCVDFEHSARWDILRAEVRRQYLADGRRMSYKSLADRRRSDALIPFLIAADELRGLCVAIVTNKTIRHLCLSPAEYDKIREVASFEGRWKDRELEEALRATHIVGCLVGGLSQPGQNVYWVSDEDSLFANASKSQDVARLLSSWSSHYAPHSLGQLGIYTTVLDERDRRDEDLVAIADLVAGGLTETTNRLADQCGLIPAKVAIQYSQEFLPKADLMARWFWFGSGSLRRVAVLFEPTVDGGFHVSKHEMLRDPADSLIQP